jgi:hypothetical protein
MMQIPLALAFALFAHGVNEVSHWPPCVLRGESPTTGASARLPPRTAAAARFAGELGLDGWLGEGVLLLSDGCERDAKELLAQAVRARAAVDRSSPALPLPTRAAPLVVFHFRNAALYRALLARLEASEADRDGLLAAAKAASGFELVEPPLCAVCAEHADPGTGAHDAGPLRANLLVHLVAHAFFDAGFGAAPEWLREGFALDVEAEICGEPEAFCRRGPHELPRSDGSRSAAWTRRLAAEWGDGGDARFDELFALDCDGYHEAAAWRALALVRWLRERRATRFVEIVDAAADAQRASCDGSAPPPEAAQLQARGLASALGPKWRSEFLAALAELARGGGGRRSGR